METQLEKLGTKIPYHRWPATDGSKLTNKDYNSLEIPAWSRPQFTVENRQKIRKGEIGCYLSHLRLLEHLQTLSIPSHKGHLILEDDIEFDPDFLQKAEKGFRSLPSNWDILTFGLSKSRAIDVKNHIGRLIWFEGTYGYLVKHESIPKILELIRTINEPYDTTLARLAKTEQLNVYSYIPSIIKPRQENDTTMNGESS